MLKARSIDYGLAGFSLIAYLAFGYLLQRHETQPVMLLFAALFAVYAYLIFYDDKVNLKFWLTAAFVFRICFLFSIPSMSDDIYRFIWDGRLMNAGISPYAFLPSELVSSGAVTGATPALFSLLNSQEHYSIYPPLAQIVFWLATWLFPNSVLGATVVIRLLIIAAELGSVWVIIRLLNFWELPRKHALMYALNPLVILELAGNLHFEAFVVFFVLLAILLLLKTKWLAAGVSMSMAIAMKLLPAILLPLFLLRLGWRRSIAFYATTLIATFALFVPFYSSLGLAGFVDSFQLYFKKFEFNASIYYLVREYGYWHKGYNIIQTVGWKLGVYALGGILLISFWPWSYKPFKKWSLSKFPFPESMRDAPEVAVGVFFVYFLFATTVHPWYIIVPLVLSIFTYLRFPILWSLLIFSSYAGYTATGFRENLLLTSVEYACVLGCFSFEIWNHNRKKIYPQ